MQAYAIYDGYDLVASVNADTDKDAIELVTSGLGYEFTGLDLSLVKISTDVTLVEYVY